MFINFYKNSASLFLFKFQFQERNQKYFICSNIRICILRNEMDYATYWKSLNTSLLGSAMEWSRKSISWYNCSSLRPSATFRYTRLPSTFWNGGAPFTILCSIFSKPTNDHFYFNKLKQTIYLKQYRC